MQDSVQYFINTEASDKFAVAGINKRLVCKCFTASNIVKMEEQATLGEKFGENDFDLCTAIKGWTKMHDILP